ncbi:MAG: glycoside hydrolase family 3 C-terminal domain-containing protein [Smithella sp.]|nr:glycoside hydrolase family 3 C-terminal domain-containing protein [Smithella sp.]
MQKENENRNNTMEKKIEDILSRMSLNEKLGQMRGIFGLQGLAPFTYGLFGPFKTKGVKRLGIPPFVFSDGPRGIVHSRKTCFPATIGRGACWDPELEYRIGRAIGMEALEIGANACGAVCINLLSHPAWGRAQETYGADSVHVGKLGAGLVKGLAEFVMPVVKHFACNNIENSRFRVSVKIDERTLREIYLPHFRTCLDAGAAVVMSAYNRVNGDYCGENEHLLKDILKGEWDFKGFVISDWFLGCRSTVNSIKAGLDVEMPQGYYFLPFKIKRALKKGEITNEMIDEATRRILRMKMKFGFTGNKSPGKINVDRKSHADLALESARKSVVLLKNEKEVLPFDRSRIKTIAVVGSLADRDNLGSRGSTDVRPPWFITPLAGIRKLVGPHVKVVTAGGGKKALQLARQADAVVIVEGLTRRDEGEYFPFLGGGDRTKLELAPDKEKLIRDVAAVNAVCAVVLIGGSAISISSWINDVPSVLMAWYPGMQGGRAIADILFGDENPSGRLPVSFPKTTAQLPAFDNVSNEVVYDFWHDYRFYDMKGMSPQFSFGHGLSYTAFAYSDFLIENQHLHAGEILKLSFVLKNIGSRSGYETAQVYIGGDHSAQNPRVMKELKAFRKVYLKPGEQRRVDMEIPVDECSYYDVERKKWRVEKRDYKILVGASSTDIRLNGIFIIS